MLQRRIAFRRGGGSITPVPVGIVSNPVLDPALEGNNLSLTPAVISSPPPTPTSTYTLYINSVAVPGYIGVSLATLQGYVWQNSDTWLDAYVDETISSPWIIGSPVTVSSNTVNVEANSLILLIQTDAGTYTFPPPLSAFSYNPETTNTQFKFYANAGSTYDIDWGDGTIQNGVTGNQTRTYASAGTYRVRTRNWSGATIRHNPPNPGVTDAIKILELQQWGNTAWTSCEDMFLAAGRMIGTYTDSPNLSLVTDMTQMFRDCGTFNGSVSAPGIDTWNISGVTSLFSTFQSCLSFNQPLDNWDTSSVTNMNQTFAYSHQFNQPLNSWDTSSVTNMAGMFWGWSGSPPAYSFNQPLNNWDVSNVTDMSNMFAYSRSFNQDLGSWVLNNSVLMTNMLNTCGMNTENYSRTLIGWANEWSVSGNPINRSLGAVGCTYHNTVYGGAPYDNAVSARAALVLSTGSGGAGWTITGDALVP